VLGRVLPKLKIMDRRKVASHSWRHRFKVLCRGAGIEQAVHDALTGHSSGNGYGLGYPLRTLAVAIESYRRRCDRGLRPELGSRNSLSGLLDEGFDGVRVEREVVH
jgi:hypothetical protein